MSNSLEDKCNYLTEETIMLKLIKTMLNFNGM